MFMYIDDLMSDDQSDSKVKKVKDNSVVIKEKVRSDKLSQHQKVKRSRVRRLRADRRKRHKKRYSPTTVSDFEIRNDDDFPRYVEVWDKVQQEDGHVANKPVIVNSADVNAVSNNNVNISLTNRMKDQNRTILKEDKASINGKEKTKHKGRKPEHKNGEASEGQIHETESLVKNITSVISKVNA